MSNLLNGRKTFLFCLGLLLIFLPAGVRNLRGDVLSLTLEEAIELSLTQNEEVKIAREAVYNRDAQVGEVRSGILPSLTGQANYTRNIKLPVLFFGTEEGTQQISIGEDNAYDFHLVLEQDIDVFGRIPRALNAAHLYSDIGREDLQQVESEVVFNVKSLYYGVILAEEMKDVAEMSLEQAEDNLRQVESMVREGTRSRFDLLRARVEVSNRNPELIRARNEVELSRSRLKRILGLPLDSEIVLTDELTMETFEMTVDEGIELALSRRPELNSIQMQEEMGKVEVTLSKLEYFPTLLFQSRYSVTGQTDRSFPDSEEFARSWNASIGLSLPIFDGLRTSSKINQAQAQLSMTRYQRKKAEEEIRLEVIETFREIETAREEIMSQEANVEEAEEAYRLSVIRFTNGLATQLEVNDVELALNLARTNYVQSLYDYNTARARVEKAIGEEVR
jgi:outer membrane protein TolC